jgi:hypothetical protein
MQSIASELLAEEDVVLFKNKPDEGSYIERDWTKRKAFDNLDVDFEKHC